MPTGWARERKALKLHEKDLWQIFHSYEMSKGQKVGGLDGEAWRSPSNRDFKLIQCLSGGW